MAAEGAWGSSLECLLHILRLSCLVTHTHIHALTHSHTRVHTHYHTHSCMHTRSHTHLNTFAHSRAHAHSHTLALILADAVIVPGCADRSQPQREKPASRRCTWTGPGREGIWPSFHAFSFIPCLWELSLQGAYDDPRKLLLPGA